MNKKIEIIIIIIIIKNLNLRETMVIKNIVNARLCYEYAERIGYTISLKIYIFMMFWVSKTKVQKRDTLIKTIFLL